MYIPIKQWREIHLRLYAEYFDELLKREKFIRNPRSVNAKRISEISVQEIRAYCSPSRNRHSDVIAKLGAQLVVGFPEIADVVRTLKGKGSEGDKFISTVNFYQIGHLGPYGQFTEWSVNGREDFEPKELAMRSYMEQWLLPFANQATTVDGFLKLYEKHPQKYGSRPDVKVKIIAMYILKGNIAEAKKIAHQVFDDYPWRRAQLAPQIDYVYQL